MNYKEISDWASEADHERFGGGMKEMNALAQRLQAEGRLPKTFEPILHPSLVGKARVETLEIVPKSTQELLDEFDQKGVSIDPETRKMIEDLNFSALEPRTRKIVRVPNTNLALSDSEIFGTEKDVDEQGNPAPFTKGRITELGLEFLSPEVAIQYFFQNIDLINHDEAIIAGMKPITVRIDMPTVSNVPFIFQFKGYETEWVGSSTNIERESIHELYGDAQWIFGLLPPAKA